MEKITGKYRFYDSITSEEAYAMGLAWIERQIEWRKECLENQAMTGFVREFCENDVVNLADAKKRLEEKYGR